MTHRLGAGGAGASTKNERAGHPDGVGHPAGGGIHQLFACDKGKKAEITAGGDASVGILEASAGRAPQFMRNNRLHSHWDLCQSVL